MGRLRLTKHHGLGNDFLVAIEPAHVVDGPLARRLCDRRRGIGADGLIVAGPAPTEDVDATMTLYNSDGSQAEMSGNGIRCLAQALARQRGIDTGHLAIHTAAGRRVVALSPGPDRATLMVRVDMGRVGHGPVWAPSEAALALSRQLSSGVEVRAATADVGNPHLVLAVADPWSVDVAAAGPLFEADFPGGVNVHFIAPAAGRPNQVDLAVWERGAGVTEACGTGACAAATVAHGWGMVGPVVGVSMPGGDVTVEVGEQATLVGPSCYIAEIEVDLG